MKMFLNRLRKMRNNEDGAGLITVMGIGLVVGIMILSITSVTAFGASMTSTRISTQQASANADVAIKDALYSYTVKNWYGEDGTECKLSGFSNDSKAAYKFNIYHSDEAKQPKSITDNGVVPGCPDDWNNWIIVEAIGYGKNNASAQKTAIFKIMSSETANIPEVLNGNNVTLKDTNIMKAPGTTSNIAYLSAHDGSFSCEGSNVNSTIRQNSYGTTNINCDVQGNLLTNGSVNIGNGKTLVGDVCTKGSVSSSDEIIGEVQYYCSPGSMYMYGYVPDTNSNPDLVINVKPEECDSWSKLNSKVAGIVQSDERLVDLRQCANLPAMLSDNGAKSLTVNSDLTFVMNSMSMNNLSIKSGDKSLHKANFVVPSAEANQTRSTCVDPSVANVNNFTYTSGTFGNIYTPCSMNITNSSITGQVYSGGDVSITDSDISFAMASLPYPVEPIEKSSEIASFIRVK